MANNENVTELELEEFDDGVRRDATHEQSMQHLIATKKAIRTYQEKRKAVAIPIQGGMILTTCPEKWEQHNKAFLRGNAIKPKNQQS